MTIRILVWNEDVLDRIDERVRRIYPRGMHAEMSDAIGGPDVRVTTATFDDAEQGLGAAALEETDVLVFWAHARHEELSDDVAERIVSRVQAGMGFVALHSAHFSKPFRRLMGTSCTLQWREAGEREIVWTIEPSHPIAEGLPPNFELAAEETYGERFDVPPPDELVFVSSFPQGGEVFRSGCCWRRGAGKLFYFRPGHETYPTYREPLVRRVLFNAARWAAR